MCLLILFSLYSNNLLKSKNCVIKTCFLTGLEFTKKNFICKEKFGTVTKIKLNTKINYFGTLVLASYCYSGDNA